MISRNWKRISILAATILFTAGFLRFTRLNSLPIFADEAIYVRWSQVMRAEPTLRFLPLSDGKQPLFMWATIPLFKIFSDPLIAGRVLSGLAGLGTVAGITFAAHLLFKNNRLTLLAGLLSCALPYLVFFNRLALADSLLTLFIIWTFVFSYLSIIHRRLDMAMLAGFTLGFAWLTKSPAIFAIFLTPSLLLFVPKVNSKNLLVSCSLCLVPVVIATAMYNILRLGPEFHQIALRNADYVFKFSEILSHPLDPLLPHLKDSLEFFLYFLTPAGLLFSVWGIFDGHRTHLRQRLVLSLWFVAPVLVQSAFAKAFTARYLLFSVPFAVILAAHAIEHIGQKSQRRVLYFAASSLILIPSFLFNYFLIRDPASVSLPRIERSGYLEGWTAGHGLREISAAISQSAKSGPVVVGSEGFFGTPFSALELYLNSDKNVRVVGVGTDIGSVPDKLLSARADNQVFLVVNSSRFNIADPEKSGLKLLSSYPKAVRPDGTREYTLFFQLSK